MTIQEVVAKFNTTPFLFAGSGITRRYYGLPDWIGLLTYFANKVKKDQFAYQYYENKANISEDTTNVIIHLQIAEQIVQIYLVQCFLPIPSGELMTKDGVMESIRPVTMAPPLPRHQPFSSRTSRTTLSISGVTLIIRWRLDTLTTASSKSISSRPVMASRIRT